MTAHPATTADGDDARGIGAYVLDADRRDDACLANTCSRWMTSG